jgi:hypothetical protein
VVSTQSTTRYKEGIFFFFFFFLDNHGGFLLRIGSKGRKYTRDK